MMRDGFVHDGINLAFRGGIHRINLTELSGGRSVMVYAQHEVLKDLIAEAARRRRRRPVRGQRHDGRGHRVRSADGSVQPRGRAAEPGVRLRDRCRRLAHLHPVPHPRGRGATDFFRQYPFAWFGILAEAPPSSDELIYAHSSGASCSCRRARRACSGCTSSATRRPTPTTGPTTASGRSSTPASGLPGSRSRRHDLQEGRAAVPLLRLRAHAVRAAVPRGRLRAHRAADGREGAQPRHGRRARARPGARGVLRDQGRRRCSSPTPTRRCGGSGGRSGSRSG